jgi:1-acyl-sn-glycerol-3-phosphate acyltransferase
MRTLLRQPLARRLLAAAGVGSLTDWVVFSALVAIVVRLTAGSVFAVALVTAARILPAIVLGPMLAPFAGVLGFRRTLVAADLTRLVGVGLIVAASASPVLGVAAVAVALVLLEFAAAVGSATREAVISAGVDRRSFPAMNAATGALAYGLLPLGGALGALALRVHPLAPFWLCAVGYATTAAIYAATPQLGGRVRLARRSVSPVAGLRRLLAAGPLRDTVAAATLGILAVAMLFSIGTRLAVQLLGSADDYGLLLGLVGVGALGGGLLAQRRDDAGLGMLAGAVGSLALLGPRPVAVIGLVVVGVGAGLAYVNTQAQLQRVGRTPEEFAAAFAVLRVGLLAALVSAPALYTLAGPPAPVAAMAVVACGGAVWSAGRVQGAPLLPRLLRTVGRPLLRAVCRIEVTGALPPGGAVLASTHPSYLDGLIAVYLDGRVRPVAKPQRNPLIRAGYRLYGNIVTNRRVVDEAVALLRRGGIVWIVPEGRLNRGPTLLPPRLGAARMAAEAGVPIVPMAIRYSPPPRLRAWRPWRRIRAEVALGAPITVPAAADPRAVLAVVMGELSRLSGMPSPPSTARV